MYIRCVSLLVIKLFFCLCVCCIKVILIVNVYLRIDGVIVMVKDMKLFMVCGYLCNIVLFNNMF